MEPDIVSITDLRHRYGRHRALDGVDLSIAPGECVALLGPNGAGKTTLVTALTGVITPSGGRVRLAGGDPRDARTRRRLGVVHQTAGFPRTLRVGEVVGGWAVRAGRPAALGADAVRAVGLADEAQRRVTTLSGGQQQRLQLAMALAVDPMVLVLDEPTVGLDIEARRGFWRTIAAERDRGVAVLLTTHQVEEAAAVADRVVLLDHGRVVASDHPAALTARLPDRVITARTGLTETELAALPDVGEVGRAGGHARLTSCDPERTVRALLAADPTLSDLRVEGASLEEAIVSLTARTQEVPA